MDQLVRMIKESILFSDLPAEVIEHEILPYGKLKDFPKSYQLIQFQEKMDFLVL